MFMQKEAQTPVFKAPQSLQFSPLAEAGMEIKPAQRSRERETFKH